MAHCRLLERQGILRGKLNIVQELALRAAIKSESDINEERQKAVFKLELFKSLIAHHAPRQAWAIVEGEAGTEDEEYSEVEELTGESADELEFMHEQMAQFNLKGYAVEEV